MEGLRDASFLLPSHRHVQARKVSVWLNTMTAVLSKPLSVSLMCVAIGLLFRILGFEAWNSFQQSTWHDVSDGGKKSTSKFTIRTISGPR